MRSHSEVLGFRTSTCLWRGHNSTYTPFLGCPGLTLSQKDSDTLEPSRTPGRTFKLKRHGEKLPDGGDSDWRLHLRREAVTGRACGTFPEGRQCQETGYMGMFTGRKWRTYMGCVLLCTPAIFPLHLYFRKH